MTAIPSSTRASRLAARRAAVSTEPSPPTFREATRHLPAGVCVISIGEGAARTGLTATSVSPFSLEPPTLLVTFNRALSSYEALTRNRAFGVNVLAAGHHAVANAFSGREGAVGAERYAAGRWLMLASGVSVLSDAVAAFDCELEERIERHTHAIVIGRVRGFMTPAGPSALVYWRGGYDQLGWTDEEVSRAVGLRPPAPAPRELVASATAPDLDDARPSSSIVRLKRDGRP
jgi:flavin reductase (DIM6/NTAB) family NADH-FMN oxidoreductase RutF